MLQVLMFPPSLYRFVVNDMKKEMILVLNKIDLAPAPLVVAWHDYFTKHFPSLRIVMFTSFPGYNVVGQMQDKAGWFMFHYIFLFYLLTYYIKPLLKKSRSLISISKNYTLYFCVISIIQYPLTLVYFFFVV